MHKANIPSEYLARIDADYMRKKEHEDIQREIEADYSILDDDNEIAVLDDQQLYKTVSFCNFMKYNEITSHLIWYCSSQKPEI